MIDESTDYLQGIKVRDFADLGNVSGELPKRKIVPHGCVNLQGLILKQYTMKETGKVAPTEKDLTDISRLLQDDIKEGKLKSLSGIGFSIISSGIVNICRWDTNYVDVVVPKIYTLEKGLWMPQEVETVGAFCSGEKRVYDHENNAWLKYLGSKRTNIDKINYLTNFLGK